MSRALLFTTLIAFSALADPIKVVQRLDQKSSSLAFRSSGPQKFSGSFRSFSGILERFGNRFEDSKIRLSLDLDSVALPPNQLMQAIFLQTAIQYLKQRSVEFESDRITPTNGGRYLVSGRYNWKGKSRSGEVPIEVLATSAAQSRFKIALNGEAKVSEEQIGSGLFRGDALADLVFRQG